MAWLPYPTLSRLPSRPTANDSVAAAPAEGPDREHSSPSSLPGDVIGDVFESAANDNPDRSLFDGRLDLRRSAQAQAVDPEDGCSCENEGEQASVATARQQRRPEPNRLYRVGDYIYRTDTFGRVTCASGKLRLEKGGRSAYWQKKVGDSGYWHDDGGHLIGDQFGGKSTPLNMLPQHWGLNRGAGSTWRFEIEDKLAGLLEDGHEVWLKVRPQYAPVAAADSVAATRPIAYAVEYRVVLHGEAAKTAPEADYVVRHYLYNTRDGKLAPAAEPAERSDLRRPEPNAHYLVGSLVYTTDHLGRVSRVSGQLALDKQRDSYYYRRKIGKLGNKGDEGAHLIDRRFGGKSVPLNLVPLDRDLNRDKASEWMAIENQIAEALEEGREVNVDFEVRYPAGSTSHRPDEILAAWGIDKASYQRRVENEHGDD